MSDDEARRGARTRAARAIESSGADFGVGLEGGLQQVETQWLNSGWAVVVGRSKTEGIGTTIRMAVPATVMALVLAGAELGDACDQVFAVTESKRTSGLFGLLSNGAIHRSGAFRGAVVAALTVFLRPELQLEKN